MTNQPKQAGAQPQTVSQRMMSSLGQEIHPAVEVRGERAKPRGQTSPQKSEFSRSISDSYFIPGIMGRARCLADAPGLSSERPRRPSRGTIKGSSMSSIPGSTGKVKRRSSESRMPSIPVSTGKVERRSSEGRMPSIPVSAGKVERRSSEGRMPSIPVSTGKTKRRSSEGRMPSIPVSTGKVERRSSEGRMPSIPIRSTWEVQRRSSMGWIPEDSRSICTDTTLSSSSHQLVESLNQSWSPSTNQNFEGHCHFMSHQKSNLGFSDSDDENDSLSSDESDNSSSPIVDAPDDILQKDLDCVPSFLKVSRCPSCNSSSSHSSSSQGCLHSALKYGSRIRTASRP